MKEQTTRNSGTKHADPVRLVNARAQSETTVHGLPSILLGIPFAGVGHVGLLAYLGVLPLPADKVRGPVWMIGVFAGFFLVAGLFLLLHGARGMQLQLRVRQGKRRAPESPWLWDYPWNRRGIANNQRMELARYFTTLLVFTGFLVPFNWFAFYSPESVLLAQLVVGVLDLAVVGGAVQGVYKGIQYFKYGRSRLLFQSFPFFLGSSLAVTLEGLPPREKLERLSLNVRFIEEKYVTRGRYGNRDARVECYEVYADSRELAADALPRHGRLNLEWNLPDDPSLLSNLSSRPARFWELEVEAEIPGVNFHDRFLLPVYARSG